MADASNERLAELERLDEDLFDFPDVLGMAELLAASRAQAVGQGVDPARAVTASTASKTPVGATAPKGEPRAPLPSAGAALPRNADDLDEDLFGFGELMELGSSAGLGDDDLLGDANSLAELAADTWAVPTPPTAKGEPASKGVPAPSDSTPASAQAKSPASGATKVEGEAHEPAQAKVKQQEQSKAGKKPEVNLNETVREPAAPEPAPSRAIAANTPPALGAGANPFLNFPNGIDLPPARSKLLWVLVGCFLVVNASIFLLTQQQSQSVNQTLMTVTSTLAEAFARGAQSPTAAPAPVTIVQSAPVERAREPGLTVLDSSDYANTQEFALAHARRLIEKGHYEDARKSLFRILASQDRGEPMTVALREDIDYLIALTLFDQGKTLANEVVQR